MMHNSFLIFTICRVSLNLSETEILPILKPQKTISKTDFFPQIEKLGYGNYAVILKEGNVKIGAVGIFERDGLDVADIGFSVLEAYEGKGLMFEASKKIKDEVMQNFGLKKISAITTKDNISSQKLIQKLGLEFKKFVTLPNDDEELMYFESL